MPPTITDRNVGALDLKSPLPHHLSPAPKSSKLSRHNSESSLTSPGPSPAVPRSSSFTGSKRFLTGKGLSARESLGIIDTPERSPAVINNAHFDYHAARNIIMGTLTHSPKEAPPPPKPPTSITFVGKRPPTPPPMPDFNIKSPLPKTKRVRIDSKPPVELPAVDLMDTPGAPFSTPERSISPKRRENKRTPLRSLSPLRNRFSLSPSSAVDAAGTNLQDLKPPRQGLFGLFSSRIGRRDGVPTSVSHAKGSTSQDKQNAAPLNIAELTNAAKIDFPVRKTDENNKPVFDVTDTSSDDSASHQIPNAGKRMGIINQTRAKTEQRQHAPLDREKEIVQIAKDNESAETADSDKYKNCESPGTETKRRVEIFKRFRFVQEGKQKPEQLSDLVQTDVQPKVEDKPLSGGPSKILGQNMRVQPVDPISHHEDKLSYTSAPEDSERSSDEKAPAAIRNVHGDPRMRMGLLRPIEPELKTFEEEKGHLPHVESVTTSSSSHSKDVSDSPPVERETSDFPAVERKLRNAVQDTSVPFSQIEMPHLRLGKGIVSAHAFMSGPSPSKLGKVAQMRRDSHAAFLNVSGETKLEEIKYGGNEGERETAPLGLTSTNDGSKEGGEIKKTMSGLQKKLKEAGAEFVSKAKKLPRGTSFSKLRSNSMKDLRIGLSAKESEADRETADEEGTRKKVKDMTRSKSLPRDSVRGVSRAVSPNDAIAKVATQLSAKDNNDADTRNRTVEEVPEFVTIKRIIRRVRRDGTEELITKKVRVRPEQVLPNGDVVIRRTMKRNKDDGTGTETLNVMQVIPRRKNVKKIAGDGKSREVIKNTNSIGSLPKLDAHREDKGTKELGETGKKLYGEGILKISERPGSLQRRRSSNRSKTDMVDEGGRKERAESFGRGPGDMLKAECEQRIGVLGGVKGLLPRSKSGSRAVDRETAALGGHHEEQKTRMRKKSLPRLMSFHGRSGKRKESGASSKSEGSWWRFRRPVA